MSMSDERVHPVARGWRHRAWRRSCHAAAAPPSPPARPSPCTPGSWWPSRNSRWSRGWRRTPGNGTWCRPRPAHAIGDLRRAARSRPRGWRCRPSRRARCRAPRRRADGSPAGLRRARPCSCVRRVCAPTLYCVSTRPVVSSSGKRLERALVGGHVVRDVELALAAHELPDVHGRRAVRRRVVAGPLDAAEPVELLVAHAGERRRERARSRP